MNARLRSYGYALAILLMVLVVGWVGYTAGRELRQLHRSFSSVQADDIYLSEYVEAALLDMNETALRVSLRHDPTDETTFQKADQNVEQWIHAHTDTLSTPEQRELMRQIGVEFEAYAAKSTPLMGERTQDGLESSKTVLETLDNN